MDKKETLAERALWIDGFMSAASAILVSEIGDKTFFIACLMAMRSSRLVVYCGALSALALMTVLSSLMGLVVPNVLSVRLTQLVAVGLFTVFGVTILFGELRKCCRARRRARRRRSRDTVDRPHHRSSVANVDGRDGGGVVVGSDGDDNDDDANSSSDEMAEAAAALRAHNVSVVRVAGDASDAGGGSGATTMGAAGAAPVRRRWRRCLNPVFVEAFTLTFVAEWGDRSQLATIALAAAKNAVAVTLGGILGHAICTGCAVLSGNIIAKRVSTRTINVVGGVLFLLFAAGTLYEYFTGTHAIERTHTRAPS